jgi:L-fucose isomerase-like protein
MLTESTWKKEVALYLAARDRLRELEEENIVGVSIKCQPELSVEYGVTPCLIPSFFPFSEDDTGRKPIISTTCEGDIKGLLSCVLLTMLSPDIPALFGDIRDIRDDYILISNCGGSSVFYAQNSSQLVEVLPRVTIAAQCQGAGGGAVGYNGVAGEATVARFIRIKGRYYMQMGIGKFLPATERLRQSLVFGQTWPLVLIALGTKQKNLIRATGSNHYCALVGNYAREIEYFCRASGIPIVRMDSDSDLERFVQELKYT